jgi:hypothetical protein
LIWRAVYSLKRWEKLSASPIPQSKLQLFLWIAIVAMGLTMLIFFNKAIGILLLFLVQTLPTHGRIWSWLIDYDALKNKL